MFVWNLGNQIQFVSSAWLTFSDNILQCLSFAIKFGHFIIIYRNTLCLPKCTEARPVDRFCT